ncbi:MAG TPA: hypothetical protein VEK79_15585 [Thermoanaerobaculia bacterium]|nr:hypothetical protein [Thermoanaerobaculia bacterium]
MRNTLLLIVLAVAPAALGGLQVVVDGESRPTYHHRGATYIEAIRGREYALRITNPYPYRVAVALAVDGLNTIDAKHTSGWNAAKWVLEPYESAEIEGWQVSDHSARRFFFTGERSSYGAAIGETENLGVIEAVFFRERERRREYSERRQHSPAPAPSSREGAAAQEAAPPSDDYAATGMGHRTRHDVDRVHIELERTPILSVRLRYEFRPQLVKLGVFPKSRAPLHRREKARGFEYCPEPH